MILQLSLILISAVMVEGLGGGVEGGQQPNPIASLFPFVMMGLVVYLIVRRSRKHKRSTLPDKERLRLCY